MPSLTPKLIPQRLPRLDSLNNKKIENEIYQSFQRVYDSLENYTRELETKIEILSGNLSKQIEKQSTLINGFGTQLITTQKGIATLGEGDVSSVDISVPPIFSISGNPITSSGIIAISINSVNFKARVISDVQIKYTSTAADPLLADYPNDKDFGFHVNTVSTLRYFVYNNSGTIFKVQIT